MCGTPTPNMLPKKHLRSILIVTLKVTLIEVTWNICFNLFKLMSIYASKWMQNCTLNVVSKWYIFFSPNSQYFNKASMRLTSLFITFPIESHLIWWICITSSLVIWNESINSFNSPCLLTDFLNHDRLYLCCQYITNIENEIKNYLLSILLYELWNGYLINGEHLDEA